MIKYDLLPIESYLKQKYHAAEHSFLYIQTMTDFNFQVHSAPSFIAQIDIDADAFLRKMKRAND